MTGTFSADALGPHLDGWATSHRPELRAYLVAQETGRTPK